MIDRPLISVATLVAPLVMTRFGGAFGVHAFVHSAARRVVTLELTLVQGDTRVGTRDAILVEGILDAHLSSSLEPNYAAGLDGGFYASALFAFDGRLRDGLATVEAVLGWDDGNDSQLRLCYANVQAVAPVASPNEAASQFVGIAMATYNPDPGLFAGQIASIRAQTHADWLCVISDDRSSPSSIANIEETIAGDPRFVLVQGSKQLGFYRNFERALALLPEASRFLTFSDQDDVWTPDRLQTGLDVLCAGRAECVYSDMEVVHSSGRRLSPSFWVHRRPEYGSLTGLMLANVVTGMTMTFNASLRPIMLPFPATPNLTYHDAWIALVAEGRKSLAYIPKALVHYVQHSGNHTGALTPPRSVWASARSSISRLIKIIKIPFDRPRNPERVKALLADLSYWSDAEPTRLRVLAYCLARRIPQIENETDYIRAKKTFKTFSAFSFTRAKIDWKDRYRRSVALELFIAALTRKVVFRYIGERRKK